MATIKEAPFQRVRLADGDAAKSFSEPGTELTISSLLKLTLDCGFPEILIGGRSLDKSKETIIKLQPTTGLSISVSRQMNESSRSFGMCIGTHTPDEMNKLILTIGQRHPFGLIDSITEIVFQDSNNNNDTEELPNNPILKNFKAWELEVPAPSEIVQHSPQYRFQEVQVSQFNP